MTDLDLRPAAPALPRPRARRRYPSFLHLLQRRAAAQPDAAAVVDDAGTATYAELLGAARRVAGALAARGVGTGDTVGVQLPRTREALAVFLGAMLAGAAYVPLDPAHPLARRRQMVARARCAALVVDPLAADRGELAGDTVLLAPADVLAGPEATAPAMPAEDQLAYVLFTSGSTGEPKGVQVTHGNVDALLAWTASTLTAQDVVLTSASTSFTFDPSVLELYGTLVLGGTLHLLGSAVDLAATSPELTFLFSTPSVLGELARAGVLPGTLRTVMVGGEALPAPVVEAVFRSCPDARLLHVYGPTEATVWVTCQELRRGDGQEIRLGAELPGTRLWVLAADGTPAPAGEPGELCIAGDQVAVGYIGRPDLTAERFVPWTTPDGDPERIYRTGDLAARDADGGLRFLGRIDRQVKLRGHRIELDEVQKALLHHPGIAEAVVVVGGEGALAHLVAFVVLDPAARDLPDAELLAPLRERVAGYMVPSVVRRLEEMPRTVSGKADAKTLAEQVRHGSAAPAAQDAQAAQTALTETEQLVAAAVAEVLGLPTPPAAEADFLLELGGTSLALLRLLGDLERTTGTRVALDGVLADPTVRGIAAQLGGTGPAAGTWLDREAPGVPLVLLHVYVGGLLKYRSLAGRLGRPLLLVDPLADGGTTQGLTLRSMAERAAAVVREQVPTGPYVLAGHSAGGLLALEVAHVLREQGAEVAEVVLLDSPSMRSRAVHYWGEVVLHAPEFWHGSWAERARKAGVILAKRSRALRGGAAAQGVVSAVYERENASTAAVVQTRSRVYDGPVSVLRTAQGRVMALGRADLGWAGLLTGRVRVRRVPGLHNGIFEAAHVGALATVLRERVAEALVESQERAEQARGTGNAR
ncbi:hypothetical protein NUM3379_32720 [Kineococcus sp. NUM-3379]